MFLGHEYVRIYCIGNSGFSADYFNWTNVFLKGIIMKKLLASIAVVGTMLSGSMAYAYTELSLFATHTFDFLGFCWDIDEWHGHNGGETHHVQHVEMVY